MICFLRCAPISEDIRLRKYIQACESREIIFFALTWNRLCRNKCESFEIQYNRYSAYGKRWRNFFNKILWQFYILWNLIKYREKYNVIHACNFDTIIPALLIRLIFGKKVIYDVYDSASSDLESNLLGRCIRIFDIYFVRKSDLLILADKQRTEQMNIDDTVFNRLLEVENVPNYSTESLNGGRVDFANVTLGYVGVFDIMRGLEELLQFVAKNDRFILNLAGNGTLISLVKEYASKCSRIIYYGVVNYEDGIKIMQGSDFIIGMYYKAASNHVYAAPNKFFEALYLGKPLITTKGTLVGKKTEQYMTGYAIDEGEVEISNFFSDFLENIPSSEIQYYRNARNASELWNNNYMNYFKKKLETEYIDLILELNSTE